MNYARILERESGRYSSRDIRRYPCNLGLFFESTTKPSFTPVFEAKQFARWVLTNDRDPVKDYPLPTELVNFYTWAQVQAKKQGIVPVRAEVLLPDEERCTGYAAPYVIFGTDDAQRHLQAFERKIADSRTSIETARHIGELTKPVLNDIRTRSRTTFK